MQTQKPFLTYIISQSTPEFSAKARLRKYAVAFVSQNVFHLELHTSRVVTFSFACMNVWAILFCSNSTACARTPHPTARYCQRAIHCAGEAAWPTAADGADPCRGVRQQRQPHLPRRCAGTPPQAVPGNGVRGYGRADIAYRGQVPPQVLLGLSGLFSTCFRAREHQMRTSASLKDT